jgi:transcriptional regulator GlxA family with amidase domain
VGIFVFDDAEELDVVGPYEVLTWWAGHSELKPEVVTFSTDGLGVRCAKGLRLVPDLAADEVDPLHVLVYPGGRGTRRLLKDPAHLQWVRTMRSRTPLMASVCTGALVFAAAGLLAGRPATTYWGAFDELAEIDRSVLADTEARFVDDGDVVTSAGVSAGIDMALHLVARLESVEEARTVRRGIQYDPAPPV